MIPPEKDTLRSWIYVVIAWCVLLVLSLWRKGPPYAPRTGR